MLDHAEGESDTSNGRVSPNEVRCFALFSCGPVSEANGMLPTGAHQVCRHPRGSVQRDGFDPHGVPRCGGDEFSMPGTLRKQVLGRRDSVRAAGGRAGRPCERPVPRLAVVRLQVSDGAPTRVIPWAGACLIRPSRSDGADRHSTRVPQRDSGVASSGVSRRGLVWTSSGRRVWKSFLGTQTRLGRWPRCSLAGRLRGGPCC